MHYNNFFIAHNNLNIRQLIIHFRNLGINIYFKNTKESSMNKYLSFCN